MELYKAKAVAEELLSRTWEVKGNTYNLANYGWTFAGFDRATSRLGVCFGGRKQIGLSLKMTPIDKPKMAIPNTNIDIYIDSILNNLRK